MHDDCMVLSWFPLSPFTLFRLFLMYLFYFYPSVSGGLVYLVLSSWPSSHLQSMSFGIDTINEEFPDALGMHLHPESGATEAEGS
jgi:hypothetical protein